MTDDTPSLDILTGWATARLNEMNAAVTAISRAVNAQAQQAAAEARTWRETFKTLLRDARRANAALPEMCTQLEKAWASFEAAFSQWVSAVENHAEAFRARAVAQINAWEDLIDDYKEEVQATAPAHRDTVAHDLDILERAAALHMEKLTVLDVAGNATAADWSDALAKSRAAYGDAVIVTRRQFSKDAE